MRYDKTYGVTPSFLIGRVGQGEEKLGTGRQTNIPSNGLSLVVTKVDARIEFRQRQRSK